MWIAIEIRMIVIGIVLGIFSTKWYRNLHYYSKITPKKELLTVLLFFLGIGLMVSGSWMLTGSVWKYYH